MRVFRVGFNTCGSSALLVMFKRSRFVALHGGGRFWRRRNHPAIKLRNPQLDIHTNIVKGRPVLLGLEEFEAFLDMEDVLDPEQPVIENYRRDKVFAEHYPDAKFIPNTRHKAALLRSPARHGDGGYIQLAMDRTGLERDGVLDRWSRYFDIHHADVRSFFAGQPKRFPEFNIDIDSPQRLVEFVAPEITLRAQDWTHTSVTDTVAKQLNWKTALAT